MDTMAVILSIMKEKGITQKELCKAIGIGAPKFIDWKMGRVRSYHKYIPQIADFLGVSSDMLLGNSSAAGTGIKIPVLGRVQAGIPVEAIEDIIDQEEIPLKMAESGEYFGLAVRGDSMEPKFSEGDVVIVRRQPDLESGDIAIVMINGEDATIKKVIKQENGIMLKPSNDKYEPFFYDKKAIEDKHVEIIGKVVELRAKF